MIDSTANDKRLPGMDSPFSFLRVFFLYVFSYAFWLTGLTEILYRVTRRWPMVTAVYYHRIHDGNEKKKIGHPVNFTSKAHFEEHIRYFTKKFSPIRTETLVMHLLEKKSLPTNALIVSFDDGYRDVYEHGLPILDKYKCPAIFFIATKIFDQGYLLPADQWWVTHNPAGDVAAYDRLYMAEDDIRDLVASGYEIGAHSDSHPVLKWIDAESQKKEIQSSKRILETILKRSVDYFSYPIGGVGSEIIEIMKKAGFSLAFISRIGTITKKTDQYLLPRNGACDYPLPVLAFKLQFSILKTLLYEKLLGRH